MNRKEEIMIDALKMMTDKPYSSFNFKNAISTLNLIESMPEENCGTCKYNDKKCSCERENCCYANEGLVLITNNDFCSRWEAK